MEKQNGEPYKSIESFLIGNAQEISELKIELLKLHFQEIVKWINSLCQQVTLILWGENMKQDKNHLVDLR